MCSEILGTRNQSAGHSHWLPSSCQLFHWPRQHQSPPIGCTGKSGPPIGLANFWNAAQWFLTTYVWLEIYHKMVNIWGESCCGLITNYRSFYIFFLRKADVLHLQKENFARRLPSFSGIFIWRLTLSFAIFKTYYSLFFLTALSLLNQLKPHFYKTNVLLLWFFYTKLTFKIKTDPCHFIL